MMIKCWKKEGGSTQLVKIDDLAAMVANIQHSSLGKSKVWPYLQETRNTSISLVIFWSVRYVPNGLSCSFLQMGSLPTVERIRNHHRRHP